MKTLKIVDALENNKYFLSDGKKMYSLVLDFVDLEKPQKNDTLKIFPKLLNKNFEGFSMQLCFEKIDKNYETENPQNIAILKTRNNTYFLKRIFG